MNTSRLIALILLALLIVVLLFNSGHTSLNLLVYELSGMKALIFLGFTAVGVVVGVLLK